MSWSMSFQFARRPRRDPEEIGRDVDDELAFHLSCLEKELRHDGLDVDAAAVEARRRFGDVDAIGRTCRAIAFRERIIMQKFLIGAVIALALTVALLAALSFTMYRRAMIEQERAAVAAHHAAVEKQKAEAVAGFLTEMMSSSAPHPSGADVDMSELLDNAMRRAHIDLADDPEIRARLVETIEQSRARLEDAAVPGTVFVEGDLERPGVYALPATGLTLTRLLVSAGANEPPYEVRIRHQDADEDALVIVIEDLHAHGDDPPLAAGDLVTLRRIDSP